MGVPFLSLWAAVALAFLSSAAFAEVQRFRLNPDQSRIVTRVNDPFGNAVEGTLRLREGEARGDIDRLPESAFVNLVIDVATYNSGLGMRDEDVRQNYLDVQRHPVIRLESGAIEKVEKPGSPGAPWLVTVKARLELHGVRRELIVPVRLFYEKDRIIAQGSFRFLLEDFEIAVPRLLFLRAGNEVQVEFRMVGDRQS